MTNQLISYNSYQLDKDMGEQNRTEKSIEINNKHTNSSEIVKYNALSRGGKCKKEARVKEVDI